MINKTKLSLIPKQQSFLLIHKKFRTLKIMQMKWIKTNTPKMMCNKIKLIRKACLSDATAITYLKTLLNLHFCNKVILLQQKRSEMLNLLLLIATT